MRRVPATGVWLLASLLAGCTAPPAASNSTVPRLASPPVSTAAPSPADQPLVAEADGYTLTVTADRNELAPGDTVTFTATFHNGTDKPIDVAGSACSVGIYGLVHVALPTTPDGKAWTGIRQTFKHYALTEALGPGGPPALDPVVVSLPHGDCGQSALSTELGPGTSVSRTMAWKAEIVAGVDALAGSVPFEVSVGYDQQNGPPSYPPDYSGPMISWSPMFKQLLVRGAIHVVGEGAALKGPGEIIDAVLADRKFSAWLAKQPATSWSNANLFLESSRRAEGIVPKGPAWELDLFREPRNWAIAFVDPFDAKLLSVTYCNIPCDR